MIISATDHTIGLYRVAVVPGCHTFQQTSIVGAPRPSKSTAKSKDALRLADAGEIGRFASQRASMGP
jgi:hypothetical protein